MTTDTDNKILKKLKDQKKEEGNLPLLLEFYRKLLQAQAEARSSIGTAKPVLSGEVFKKRMRQKRPMLRFDDFALDWPLVRNFFNKVVTVFAEYPELFGEIPEKMKEPEASRLLTKKAVKAWFTGKEIPATLLDGISENLMRTIIQATLHPFLKSQAEVLKDNIEQESWRQGYCPVCGGSPDLAYLEKEVGARWLLCSRCDTEWSFQRLMCPYCNNQDQATMSFYTDDTEQYRLYICDKCQRYLKAIDMRKAKAEILLPLERLYTIDLDMQAKEYGYKPC